jgi:hypothetical protein
VNFSSSLRRGVIFAGLLLFPIAVYWNTISYRFGFRDDYSIQREAHEEPGKIMRVCSAMGRPLYGYLLEETFSRVDRIEDLQRMRLLGALMVGLAAAIFYAVLIMHDWDDATAALLSAVVAVLPGAQVFVSWAIAWPPALALALAIAGYWCAEKSFRMAMPWARFGWWVVSLALVSASLLCYQASTLLYLAPVAASLFGRLGFWDRELRDRIIRHAVSLGCSFAIATTIMMKIFASGRAPMSPRVALSPHIVQTLDWFVHFPVPNAFAVFVLKGTEPPSVLYLGMAVLISALLIGGVVAIWTKCGWRVGLLAAVATLGLPFAAHAVTLVSTERLVTYRTLIPLTMAILVIATANLTRIAGRVTTRVALGALSLAAAWTAYRQPFELIAVPQSYELKLIEEGARRVNPAGGTKVFVITPTLADAPSRMRSGDEFGSLATNSDWVPKEMFIAAVKEVFGKRVNYSFQSWGSLPKDQQFDVIVDMRRLREFRKK